MSVLIKDMGKPKSCCEVIDGEYKLCPFVNEDNDCVLLLNEGVCEVTLEEQYRKCPIIEVPEPCEDVAIRYSANYYSGRLKNDEHKAVEILDAFTKAFCIDAEAGNDLVFRCQECLFQTIDGTCLVKAFKHKFYPDYKDFGSMGDL